MRSVSQNHRRGGLLQRVTALETSPGGLVGGLGGAQTSLAPPDAVKAMEGRLLKIIEDLKNRVENQTVKIGDQTFRSFGDALGLVQRLGVPDLHLFCYDICSLLARLEDTIVDMDDAYDRNEKLAKTKESVPEQVYNASFSFRFPPVLAGKKADGSKTIDLDNPFHRISTIDKWRGKDMTRGVKATIQERMKDTVNTIQGEIDLELAGSAEAKKFATKLLDTAVADWNSLVQAVDKHYEDACTHATGDRSLTRVPADVERESWKLSLELLKAFFRALAQPRMAVQGASRMSDPARKSAHYLWATLRTTGRTEEWATAEFVKHADFVPAVIHHLYKQSATRTQLASGKDNVKKLEGLIAAQAKQIDELKEQLSSQSKEVSGVKRKADAQDQRINDLKRKVGSS